MDSPSTTPAADAALNAAAAPNAAANANVAKASAPVVDPRRWRMLAVVLVVMFMAIFDFYVINIATPSLRSQLSASDATLELIIGGYTFTYASLLVTGGRLGDVFTYRKVFLAGMALFTVSSLLCALSQTGGQLVAARLVQGVGAALMVPQVVALITVTFPPRERPRALSWFGVSIGLAVVSAQILGGLLLTADIHGIGWRIIFLINIPIGVVTLALATRLLSAARAARRPRQDIVGTVGVSVSLGLVILPVILGRSQDWPIWGWIMLALALPAMAATVLYERSLSKAGGDPMLEMTLFRARSFTVGILTVVGIMTFFSGFIFGLTLFLQAGLGLDPLPAGLTFGPMGAAFAVGALTARPLLMKYGSIVIVAGQALLGISALMLLTLLHVYGTGITAPRLVGSMVLAGLGTGITIPALTGIVVSQVRSEHAGVAGGLLATGQQFANTIGVAVFGVIFFNVLGTHPTLDDYVSAMEWVAGIGAGISAVALALTLLLPRKRSAPKSAA